MIISLLWQIFFVIFMIFCLMALLGYYILLPLSSKRRARRMIYRWVRFWGRVTVLSTGSKVEIEGLEKLPKQRNLCLVGNHQSFFDIPALLGWIGIPAGFISKQELSKIPVLSHWMRLLPCVFINRKNAREAMRSFQMSAEVIAAGNPIVLFPEGTRSKSDTLGEFKPGSLKLPQMAGAIIVPFALSGTWRIYEIDKRIHASKVRIRILDPIYPDNPLYKDRDALLEHLYSSIAEAKQELLEKA